MKLLTLFFITVISMATFVVKTSHKGHLTGGVLWPDNYWDETQSPLRKNCKAIICGDTIDFYAASYVRCDELYKYQHFIGKGKFLRTGETMYFYNPNSNKEFVTKGDLEQRFGQPVYFTDIYNCN